MRRKTLVTGTNPEKYKERGEVVHHPLIELVPIPFEEPELSGYDWIIFTSRFAVKFFFNKDKKRELPKVVAIGETTASTLEEIGVSVDFMPEEASSTGILALMKTKNLEGTKILVPCSNLAEAYLPSELQKLGAQVKKLVVYQNIKPKAGKVDLNGFDEIVFTSPSTVRNFISEYGAVPEKIRPIFIGERTEYEFSKFKA